MHFRLVSREIAISLHFSCCPCHQSGGEVESKTAAVVNVLLTELLPFFPYSLSSASKAIPSATAFLGCLCCSLHPYRTRISRFPLAFATVESAFDLAYSNDCMFVHLLASENANFVFFDNTNVPCVDCSNHKGTTWLIPIFSSTAKLP